ncbi:MAG: c-type cytochrome [Kiloniellales bacterium]
MAGRAAQHGIWIAAAGGLLALAAAAAQGQDSPGDRVAGRQFALQVCAECHLVAAEQLLDPLVGAPPFYEIAERPSTTALSLRVFFRTPHLDMPNLMLTPQETDDVITYILSLK